MRHRILALWATVLTVGTAATVVGQTTSELSGRVTSEDRAMPGVKVTVESPALQGERFTGTNALGDYIFKGLPAGTYAVTFKLKDYSTLQYELQITTSQPKILDAVMYPEAMQDEIVVAGQYETVSTGSQGSQTVQQETLESIQARFAASLATGTDVLQAQIQLQRTEAELPPLQAGVQEAIFRLSVLLGQPPGHLMDLLQVSEPLPQHPELLAVGLPSELLRRRPDIRAAERRVAAETARIGVEVAELFPRVSLTGSFGLQSAEAKDLVDHRSLTWSFGPSVRWRLLEFGRIISSITVQEERQRQALTLYHQSVLDALEQVESSLANYAAQRQRSESLADVNEVNQRAFELAKSEYAVGMISFLSVLDTQRSLFSTQTELIRARQQALVELVNLYESLGGGWPDEAVRGEGRASS